MLEGFMASKDVHEARSSKIIESMREFGFDLTVKAFNDLNSKIENYDLVVTLGGDGTFLRAAGFIHDDTPIMAINTDPTRSFCNFASFDSKRLEVETKDIWEKLLTGKFNLLKRTRLEIGFSGGSRSDEENNQEIEKHFVLNEVVFAEASIARASNFRLGLDDEPPVPYRSSGLIVSTGILLAFCL